MNTSTLPSATGRHCDSELEPELVTCTTAVVEAAGRPVMTALQEAALLTMCTALSPRATLMNEATLMLSLSAVVGMAKESAGVEANCLRLKKRWVGRSGPSELKIPSPQRSE